MASEQLVLNRQVLHETYWVLRRKPAFAAPREAARRYVMAYEQWAAAPSVGMEHAWRLEDRYGLGLWDALLMASARAAHCDCFLSEDLNDGQQYDGVTAINPFRHAPEDVLGRAPLS